MRHTTPGLFVAVLIAVPLLAVAAHAQEQAEVIRLAQGPVMASPLIASVRDIGRPPPAEAAPEVAGDSSIPEGEEELMADHAVSASNVRFDPGSGLRVTSDDGQFGLSIGTRVQGRWTVAREDGAEPEHEVTLRRVRLTLGGNAYGEDLRFKLQIGVSPSDMGIRDNLDPDRSTPTQSPLLDYYLEMRHLRDAEVRVGQFKVASNRQRVTSSGRLQLVDRSIMNSEFNLDRDVGIELRSRNLFGADMLGYRAGVFSGRGRNARGSGPLDLMYVGHLDFTPLGRFNDYHEADFERGPPRLAFGVGAAYVDRGQRDRGTRGNVPEDGGTTSSRHLFFDTAFKAAGFSLLGELAWRNGNRHPGDAIDEMGAPMPITAPRDGYGVNVQAGYLLPGLPVEVAARYAAVRDGSSSSLSDGNEVTGGLSFYPGQHAYKLQADYSRLWDQDMRSGEDRVRIQLQMSL